MEEKLCGIVLSGVNFGENDKIGGKVRARYYTYKSEWFLQFTEYLENKKRKQEAYKRHNVPIIQIEKENLKSFYVENGTVLEERK